jgi:glycerol-3-phosphate cytidylyltransferase
MNGHLGINVITLGTFDCLHIGHIKLLQKCEEIAGSGKVTVGLNSDQFIFDYKGKPPIMNYKERMDVILELKLVDSVMINSQSCGDAKQVILDSKADMIVIGSDWARKDYVKQLGIDWDWLDEHGIGICYVTYTPGVSTTEIKKRISNA